MQVSALTGAPALADLLLQVLRHRKQKNFDCARRHNQESLLRCCGLIMLLQVIRLRKKLSGAADAVKGLFGVGKGNDEVVEKLERMQVCVCVGGGCCCRRAPVECVSGGVGGGQLERMQVGGWGWFCQ
jgi:hypothetical protein